MAELNKEGLKVMMIMMMMIMMMIIIMFQPLFHVLDIGSEETVIKFRDVVKEKHGGIDVLVNNAGIAFKQAATESFGVQVEQLYESGQ